MVERVETSPRAAVRRLFRLKLFSRCSRKARTKQEQTPPNLGIDFTFLRNRRRNRASGFSSRTISEGQIACAEYQVEDESPPPRRRDSIGPAVMDESWLLARRTGRSYDRPVRALDWSAKDSARGEVYALAQTTDGILWLETMQGLCRRSSIRCADAGGLPFPRPCMLVCCRV
jgi:hypothetical protein